MAAAIDIRFWFGPDTPLSQLVHRPTAAVGWAGWTAAVGLWGWGGLAHTVQLTLVFGFRLEFPARASVSTGGRPPRRLLVFEFDRALV